MKILHTTMLNTKEFNKLSDKIIDSLYELNPDIRDLYDIHINYIDDSWAVDFVPLVEDIPVIKIETYVDNSSGDEILKIIPSLLSDLPGRLKFAKENNSYELCMNYIIIFEFILALYDFEYKLS